MLIAQAAGKSEEFNIYSVSTSFFVWF